MRPLAAIYVRISRDKEGKGLGVARQEADCRALAERLGFDVYEHVYSDNDISATRGKPRPEFVRLLEDTKAGRFQSILAWHTDRMYRRPRDLQDLTDALKVHDVSVYTVKAGALDLSTATGRLQAGIYAQIAQHEVELKGERQARKEEEMAKAGEPRVSSRAFGFEPDGKTWRQPEAQMIQQATADVLAGTSLAEIVRRWNASGFLSARGSKDWTHGRVRPVLTRWKNAGIRERNTYDPDVHGGYKIIGTELYPGTWEPLVSLEELQAVRNLLLDPKRRTGPGNHIRKHLLSFFLVCGACGNQFRAGSTVAYKGRKHLTYQCGGKQRTPEGKVCWASISYSIVEEVVRNHVSARLAFPDPSLLRATQQDREAIDANHRRRAEVEDRRSKIRESAIDDLDKLPMLERVKTDLDALAEEFERLAQRGALAETMRGFAKARLDSSGRVDMDQLSDDYGRGKDAARERFDALDLSTQRQIIESLIEVTVLPATVGRQYTGNPGLVAARVQITDLDPVTREPLVDDS